MIAPSSILTPGPITTCGSIRTSRPILASNDRNTVSGAISVAPSVIARRRSRSCSAASAAASCTRSLTPMTSFSSATRARADEAARVGDLDDVGEVIFVLGVVRRHRIQKPQRFGAVEGDRTGVAEARRPLVVARVLVLADRDQAPVALDQPAVAGRIGGLEAKRDHTRALGQPGAQRRQRCRLDERNIGVGDENVVVALRDLPTRRENGVGGASSFALNDDFRPRRDFQRLGGRRCRDPARQPRRSSLAAPSSTAESVCASIERPASSCRTLGRTERMRTPSPAASTMVRQRRALALMALLSHQGAVPEARLGGAESPQDRPARNIAAAHRSFQPQRRAIEAVSPRGAKCVSLRRKKRYTTNLAKDGTRRACGAVFSS